MFQNMLLYLKWPRAARARARADLRFEKQKFSKPNSGNGTKLECLMSNVIEECNKTSFFFVPLYIFKKVK